jgi:uncharacterized coiled-coil protein SlyX
VSTAQNPWPPIGELFVEQGHLTPAQLEVALAEQRETGTPLGEILVEHGYITRIHLAGALSKQWSWRHQTPDLPGAAAPVSVSVAPEETFEPEPVEDAFELVSLPAVAEVEPYVAVPQEEHEPLPSELPARLRETREELAGGDARIRSLEAILAELSQAYANINLRLDTQSREIEKLHRVIEEQAARLAAAGRALG